MIKEYKFQALGVENSYRQFPNEIENNSYIFFHGTAEANFENINNKGFQPKANGKLSSISFAKNSSIALGYACNARDKELENGIIIVVDVSNISLEKIKDFGKEAIYLHPKFQPKIIGYCIIPKSYQFK